MAHAASSIAANYDLVVNEFDGCATPILKGHPVSGKTTALKAVLSVLGQTQFSSGKYIIIIQVVMYDTSRLHLIEYC